MKKRLQSSKLNIHDLSLLLQEKQPDFIIVDDGDSSDISDRGSGKKTNVSNERKNMDSNEQQQH